MANLALREGVGHIPMRTSIGGSVNVDFVPARVVEIFSPKDMAARCSAKVQGTSAAKHAMRNAKLRFSQCQRYDGMRNCTNQLPRRQHHESVKTIAEKTGRER